MILLPQFTVKERPESTLPILEQYLNIQDCEATPIQTFYAKNSVDNGNNTGWTFL
jgi:hypothetical protein